MTFEIYFLIRFISKIKNQKTVSEEKYLSFNFIL